MQSTTETIQTPSFSTDVTRTGTGPTLVLIMGGGTGKSAWAALVNELAPRVSCVTYDNRGTGAASDVEDTLTVEIMARDAAEVIESLGEGPVHVAGVSMGGFIAMRLAAMRPDLILSLGLHATAAKLEGRSVESHGFRLKLLESGHPDGPELVRSMLKLWSASTKGLQTELPGDVVKSREKFSEHNYRGHMHAIDTHDMSAADLGKITAPTIITRGTHDIGIPEAAAKFLNDSIPGSRFLTLVGAGHAFYFEDPLLLATIQGGWVAQHSD